MHGQLKVVKITKALSLITLIGVLLTTGCKKVKTNPVTNATKQNIRITNQNPYNYLGAIHNGALDTVASVAGFTAMNDSQKFNIICRFNDDHDGVVTPLSFENIAPSVATGWNNSSTRFDISTQLQDSGLAADVANDVQNLMAIVGFKEDLTDAEVKSVDTVTDQIERWEADMITKYGSYTVSLTSNLDLTTDSGRIAYLLGGAAILKYSYSYWASVQENPSSPWFYTIGTATIPFWNSATGSRILRAWSDVRGWFSAVHYSILVDGQSDYIRVNVHEARAAAQAASAH